jgi:HAD superfamily hydrolase (TIGR01450 family)
LVDISTPFSTGCDLSSLKGLVLDIDGLLIEGDRALPGAVELINHLNQTATPYVLLSNNSTRKFCDHKEKLHNHGMPVPQDRIITGAVVAAKVLSAETPPGARCLVIGEAGLLEALEWAGFEVTQSDYRDITYVVVGMDRYFTYEKLLAAARAIQRGAKLISSNPDPVFPAGDELIPASGAIQAAIEASTGMKARVTGKPESYGFRLALEKLGLPAELTGMVGDQPKTDHLGARLAGMKCLLVLSSLTPSYSPAETGIVVDGVYESTFDFYLAWTGQHRHRK